MISPIASRSTSAHETRLARVPAASLALAGMLVMFTPFLRDFTAWHIDGSMLAAGAFALGLAVCLSLLHIRQAISPPCS